MFVSVSFCVTNLFLTALTWIIFFTQYIKFYAKENSSFKHGISKWFRLGRAQTSALWTVSVHYNTDHRYLCRCQACVVTADMFSTGFQLLNLIQILWFLFVLQYISVFEENNIFENLNKAQIALVFRIVQHFGTSSNEIGLCYSSRNLGTFCKVIPL